MKTGDTVYQIGKLDESKSCLSISIFKRTVGEPQGNGRWWLNNVQGAWCGGSSEEELFTSREEALKYIIKKLGEK